MRWPRKPNISLLLRGTICTIDPGKVEMTDIVKVTLW